MRTEEHVPQQSHIWTTSGVLLWTWTRPDGTPIDRWLDLPLGALDIRPDGLLWTVLKASAAPLPHQQLRRFSHVLGHLVQNAEALGLLNALPEDLGQRPVRRLFTLMEGVISEHYGKGSRYVTSLSSRYLFQQHPLPLGDGHLVKSCGFRTAFQPPFRKRGTPNTRVVQDADDESAPLRAIGFDTLAALKANTNAQLVARKAPLLQACSEILDAHEQLVRELSGAEASRLEGLPPSMQRRLRSGLAPRRSSFLILPRLAKLQVALYLWGLNGVLGPIAPTLDSDALQHSSSQTVRRRSSKSLSLLDVPLPEILSLGNDFEGRCEVLGAHICPPRRVAFACLVVLMVETGLNKQTLKARTAADVEQLEGGYRLQGVKPKTDKMQSRDIYSAIPDREDGEGFTVVSHLAVRALTTLLQAKDDTAFDGDATTPAQLFRVLRLRDRGDQSRFKPLDEGEIHRKLRMENPMWLFQLRTLRNLALQIHYTSPTGDVFSAAALAGHGNVDVTAQYLEQTVITWMHESNINKFMKMLGATILWAVGRNSKVQEHQLSSFVDRRLFFPLTGSAPQPASSVVDDWISSKGLSKLTIGVEEIHHTAFQRAFYKKNLKSLARANPTAFVRHHLPRAVVCEALSHVIYASPHKGLFRSFEEAIHESGECD